MYPSSKDLISIAQVLKSYGTEGELIISFYSNAPETIDIKEPIFIFYDELSVPFFIQNFTPKGKKKALIKLNSITSLSLAEEIVGQKIYLPSHLLPKDDDVDFLIIGFTLFDENSRKIGIIEDVQDFSGNICLSVNGNYIPFHENLVLDINEKDNTITLKIPEGLF